MRHPILVSLCVCGALALSACGQSQEDVERAVQDVISSDETNLNAIMMSAADPEEAVSYFRNAVAADPSRIDRHRGLAQSLIRAKHPIEGEKVWAKVVSMEGATDDDRVDYADALIRAGKWKEAEQVLDAIPPTLETFKRYRLEAMIADSNKEWKKADSFYETAVGLTTQPSNVLNNWGYSKLTRGDYAAAERLFLESIGYDRNSFTAKNNLVLARGAQRNYQMPVIEMTQVERAQLLYTMALSAIKQGDVTIGKGLLEDAIETHPQHFDEAALSLRALERNVSR